MLAISSRVEEEEDEDEDEKRILYGMQQHCNWQTRRNSSGVRARRRHFQSARRRLVQNGKVRAQHMERQLRPSCAAHVQIHRRAEKKENIVPYFLDRIASRHIVMTGDRRAARK